MSKFISIESVDWARNQLKASCKSLIADFFILKREGLRLGNPINITSVSTADSAKRLMAISLMNGQCIDARHFYFNPFANVNPWRHDEYPRSGTYTTIERSRPLHSMMDVRRTDGSIEIALKPDYLQHAQSTFRLRASTPVALPIKALAAWCYRYDELDDDIDGDKLVTRFLNEYGIDADEAGILLKDGGYTVPELFSLEPLPRDVLAQALLEEAAAEDQTQPLPLYTSSDQETVDEALPEDLVEYLRGPLLIPSGLLRQIVTLIRAGKHLILTGPPGTGKTTLVARLAEASQKAAEKYDLPHSKGVLFTTATADWSTFDTLGGYVPDPATGKLAFHEGILVESVRENRWVVIDELNRADIDKAFGQFFTLLSGHDVRTSFKDGEHPVEFTFDPNASASYRKPSSGTYVLGSDWRLLGTMNTFDRNLLFQLSAAFVRRFAVVYVGIPPAAELKDWLAQRDLPQEELSDLEKVIDIVTSVRPLGPAIWSDVADYMAVRRADVTAAKGQGALLEALTAYVLPQMGGLDPDRLSGFQGDLHELFTSADDRAELDRLFEEMF